MFWTKEEEENSLMQLLKSDNFTLKDVLLNEFVVQDSRYGKPELVEYITKPENMVALLNLSLNPSIDPNVPMKDQYRLSFIASEILTIRGTDIYQQLIVSSDETRKVLIDFINDETPVTHLIAGFFAKIMECLLSRQFVLLQTFSLLNETTFFEKCIQNIHLGAIECLLENLVRIPNTGEGTRVVKEWMISENVFEKVVERMIQVESDEDIEALAEVYTEILRELRDKLYVLESKEDTLHDKAMEDTVISKIAQNVVFDADSTAEELAKKSALISSTAKILESFIKTNFVRGSPAQHLDEVERNQLEERHYTYGLMRPCMENEPFEQNWQPDPERIAEGIISNRVDNILQTILRDVQVNGSVWQPLLRMVTELCNTNHLPTHEKLAIALQKLPFVKLIDAAKKMPRASVLHSLLVRMVALLLHTRFPHSPEVLSPAAEYLIAESGLIKNIYDTACSFHSAQNLVSSCGLRSFNQNLGDAIFRAKRSPLPPPTLAAILDRDQRWTELEDIIVNYNLKNRPQMQTFDDSSILGSSVRNDSSHGFNDSEEWTDASAKFAEIDALSSNNKRGFSNSFGFEVNLQRFSDMEQFEETPDEDEFKKLCSERANSSSCSGGKANFDVSTWPGEHEKDAEKVLAEFNAATSTYPDITLGSTALIEPDEDDEWVWPTEPPLGENDVVSAPGPRPDNIWVDETLPDLSHLDMSPPQVDDMWADFSSFPTTNPSTSASTSAAAFAEWPGADASEQGESSDWPLSSSNDSKPTDPATVGLAASISPPKDDNSSEA
ncbi:unnamed protein product [Caenorhabditis sp. 36 PRJEB53466]|nr:unnamed protein product [Caenorhabditis sp. 36 PRJEB53466]